MPKPFKGVVNVDIRDSVPDWEPFLPAEGARGCAERADDRLGRRRLRHDGRLRRPGRDAEHAAHRRHGRALLELPHDGAVLADALVAAHRSQRDEQRHGHASPSSPPASPASRPGSRSRTGSSPRCSTSAATTRTASGSGTSRRARSATCRRGRAAGRSAAGSSASTASSAARRTSGIRTSSTTTTTIDAAGDAGGRATTSRRTSPTRRSSSIRDAKVDRPRQAVLHVLLRRAAATRRTTCSRSGPTSTRAASTRATRRSARRSSTNQKELGLLPDDTELSPINPHGEPDAHRSRRPAVAAARHRASVGLADATTSSACSRAWPRCSPGSSPTPTTRSVACSTTSRSPGSSTTRSSSSSPTTAPAARAARTARSTSGEFFNGVADTTEANARRTSTSSARPQSYNHYNTGWAWAFDTPFPYWKRWAGYEGGVADMCLVAWPKRDQAASRRRAPPVRPRGRRRPDGLRPARHRAARGAQGLHAEPDRGRELRGRAHRPDRCRAARRSSTRCSGSARSTTRAGWRAPLHPPISGWGKFEHDEWELYDLEHDRAQSHNLAARAPRAARDAQEPVVLLRRDLQRAAARRPHRARDISRRRGRSRARRATATSTTRTRPTCPSRSAVNVRRRSYTIAAAVDIETPEAEGVLFAHGGVAGGHASTSRTGGCTTRSTGSASASRPSARTRRCPPGSHVLTRRVRRRRATTSRR